MRSQNTWENTRERITADTKISFVDYSWLLTSRQNECADIAELLESGLHAPDDCAVTQEATPAAGCAARETLETLGPYLSERQWGTVREDYSADGIVWAYYCPTTTRAAGHIAGERNDCSGFAIANAACALPWRCGTGAIRSSKSGCSDCPGRKAVMGGRRLKECYFYLDSSPTHSYLKAMYRYSAGGIPYDRLGRGKPSPHAQGARV